MPSSDRMGIAGAQCPSKVIQRKKHQPLPSGDIPQSTWQHEEGAESSAARSPQTHRGGGAWVVGAWVWRVCCCLLSPPCRERTSCCWLTPLWAWGNELPVLPEQHCVTGLCPWDTESLDPMQSRQAHEPQVPFPRVLLSSLHPWPGKPAAFPPGSSH